MNSEQLAKPADLNRYATGDFALTQDLAGGFRVVNLRTGVKTRPYSKERAIRILLRAAR